MKKLEGVQQCGACVFSPLPFLRSIDQSPLVRTTEPPTADNLQYTHIQLLLLPP